MSSDTRTGSTSDLFFTAKLYALFHDPPDKPLELAGHEERAKRIIERILGTHGRYAEELADRIKRAADILASKLDRYPVTEGLGRGECRTDKIVLSNPLYPKAVYQVDTSKLSQTQGYAEVLETLSEIYSSTREPMLTYHILYALYESEWIKKGYPLLPADTRFPTHTVFDHVYTTAAMVNWLYTGKGVEGSLVAVDVGGVQDYISQSRKLADLWASSYLVSALTWYTVLELIEKLGPDISIIPSLRLNPFYIHWLIHKLEKRDHHGHPGELEDEARQAILMKLQEAIKYLFTLGLDEEFIYNLYEKSGIPPYAVIPGRFTLALPPTRLLRALDVPVDKSVEAYLEERFNKGWMLLWEAVVDYIGSMAKNSTSSEKENVFHVIKMAFDLYEQDDGWKNSGFKENAPLTPYIAKAKVQGDADGSWMIYRNAYKKLIENLKRAKSIRIHPTARLKLYTLTSKTRKYVKIDYTRETGRNSGEAEYGEGVKYCSVCGRLPAILEVKGEPPSGILKSDERLCPWCLVKRIITVQPRLLNTLLTGQKTVPAGEDKSSKISLFPSTSSIALYDDLLEIKRNDELKEKATQICEKAITNSEQLAKEIHKLPLFWKGSQTLLENLNENVHEDTILTVCLAMDHELLLLRGRKKSGNEREKPLLEKAFEDTLRRKPHIYYALISSDADSMGKLLSANPRALCLCKNECNTTSCPGSGEAPKGYCGDCVEDVLLASTAEATPNESLREAMKSEYGCTSYDHAKARECMDAARRVMGKQKHILDRLRVDEDALGMISPTYHVVLSSMLMRSAIIDAIIVTRLDGFIVYSGGDDLLAVLPPKNALDAVEASRRLFGGIHTNTEPPAQLKHVYEKLSPGVDGFISLGQGTVLPALYGVGRSYVIYLTHYLNPLRETLARAHSLLDTSKDEYRLSIGERCLAKDMMSIAFDARGAVTHSTLPLTLSRVHSRYSDTALALLEPVKKLIEETTRRDGLFSRSLFYDAENLVELFDALADKAGEKGRPIAVKLVERLLDRNKTRKNDKLPTKKLADSIVCPGGVYIGSAKLYQGQGETRLLLPEVFRASKLAYRGVTGTK